MYYVQNTDDTVPASSSAAGTYATTGVEVTGTGTDFTALEAGDYLISDTETAVRKIQRIFNATRMVLEEAFPTNVAGDNFKFIRARDAKVTDLSVGAGTSGTTVDGDALPAGDSVNLECSELDKFKGKNFVTPVYVQGSTSGDAKILVKYFKR